MMTLHKRDDIPVKLIGSWTTSIGPIQDQAGNIHVTLFTHICSNFESKNFQKMLAVRDFENNIFKNKAGL